jgi:CheY-like chemotaxis protein
MDEATLTHAREPFFTTKGIGKGTGLGLSMVHGLAEQSGGSLALSSVVGRGTVAEIYLPEAEGVSLEDSSPVEACALPQRDRLRVLVVDDDLLVRSSVTDLLEELGHAVVQVGSGAEGLAAFKADPGFDVILTDHAMPHMTGLHFAALIREIVPLQPIILASGYAEIPEGMDLSLPRLRKPYSQAALARMLAEVVPVDEPKPQTGLVLPFRQRQSV